MSPKDLKDYYLSSYRFAKETGYSNGTYLQWVKQGYVSLKAQKKIELLTKGALKATWD